MKRSSIAIIIKYVSAFVVGAGLVVLTLWLKDYFTATDSVKKYKDLADAFTLPGVLFVCIGLIIAVANEGAFDGIGYLVKHLVVSLIPGANRKDEKYYDYKQSRKRVAGYWFIFFTGLAFLAVAVVFIILFYQVYSK